MDTQHVELLGRNLLTEQLLRAGLEVALPLRDRGVDLIVYADLTSRVKSFVAVPVQLKASSSESFGVDQKYARISNLLLVHVWHVDDGHTPEFFALLYPEAVKIIETMGYADSPSWAKGGYSTSHPPKKLRALLEKHRMSGVGWWEKIVGKAARGA